MRRLIALLTLIGALGFASPALAYNHLANCKASLLGNPGDNDVWASWNSWGGSWVGWGDAWHTPEGSVYVYTQWSGGAFTWRLGHCWGYDGGPDNL